MKRKASIATFSAALLFAMIGIHSEATESASQDAEVLNAVFADLLENSSDDFDARQQILFIPIADERALTSESILSPTGEFERWWEQLTTDQRKWTKEAVAKLVSRIGGSDPFKDYIPRDPRVKLFPEGEKPGLGTRIPFQAWPPGYSEDGTIAVVVLSFGWGSFHGASSTHVLLRCNQGWKVLIRDFTYYP